jgi:DNA sulfur modification protein DndD
MRLNTLVLRNFGLYKGKQEIDLAPRTKWGRERPIVLVGGRNGAGKTTILEAVQLCLYGRLALGSRVSDSEYQTYLRDRIHWSRGVLIPINFASVTLEFDYAHSGVKSTYSVERNWSTRGSTGVAEALVVKKDGEKLADIDAQFWPEFVRSLVPPGVSQLFFFDGEKIKRLAEEETEAATLAQSVKGLLGLDIVEQLRADLDLYASRQMKKTATGAIATRLAEVEASECEAARLLEHARIEEADYQDRLKGLVSEIETTEQLLAQRGEGFAARRGELRQKRSDLAARREDIERKLRELCETTLPFAACPRIGGALLAQLRREVRQDRARTIRREIEETVSVITRRLTEGRVPERFGWDGAVLTAIKDELGVARLDLVRQSEADADVEQVHGFSDRQREQVERTLAEALGAARERATELSLELARVDADLRDVQKHMNQAPESDEIAPIVAQLSEFQEQHARLSLELTLKSEQCAKLERDLTGLRRERERIMKAETGAQKLADRVSRALAARKALDEYLQRVTSVKTEQLESATLECFRSLCGKTDLIDRLKIDPATFSVSLFDDAGREVPKVSLSAGEKQIYAVSLLWALAKVSGRPLPMIIDTPLGRLDSRHRVNLLEKYFPLASHQVIILSTDTEVDQVNFEVLKPFTSHCIHLVTQEGWTDVTSGYFWREQNDA